MKKRSQRSKGIKYWRYYHMELWLSKQGSHMTPSKTGKTITLSLESLDDNIARTRKMKATTLVVA